MRTRPTAFGWINLEVSVAPHWVRAQVQRLARHLGYVIVWAPEDSVIPLVDQVRAADVDAVIIPGPDHLDVLELNGIMSIACVESVRPRLSFARWLKRRCRVDRVIVLGYAVAVGLPVMVIVWSLWPERVPRERSCEDYEFQDTRGSNDFRDQWRIPLR
ncbi:hypothetical protein ACFYXQ_24140 [Nocardia jiangxiensis]|uniref:Uncharacterized protein n=1 Tax=Nocardia jiangxiensis TaxID=282685 RepID=A0ABW6S3Q1_9NOCA